MIKKVKGLDAVAREFDILSFIRVAGVSFHVHYYIDCYNDGLGISS